jgi:hypothetical protein
VTWDNGLFEDAATSYRIFFECPVINFLVNIKSDMSTQIKRLWCAFMHSLYAWKNIREDKTWHNLTILVFHITLQPNIQREVLWSSTFCTWTSFYMKKACRIENFIKLNCISSAHARSVSKSYLFFIIYSRRCFYIWFEFQALKTFQYLYIYYCLLAASRVRYYLFYNTSGLLTLRRQFPTNISVFLDFLFDIRFRVWETKQICFQFRLA